MFDRVNLHRPATEPTAGSGWSGSDGIEIWRRYWIWMRRDEEGSGRKG